MGSCVYELTALETADPRSAQGQATEKLSVEHSGEEGEYEIYLCEAPLAFINCRERESQLSLRI